MAKDFVPTTEGYKSRLREVIFQMDGIALKRAQIEALSIIFEGTRNIDEETQEAILHESYIVYRARLTDTMLAWNKSSSEERQKEVFRNEMMSRLIAEMSEWPGTELDDLVEMKRQAFETAFTRHQLTKLSGTVQG